MLGDFPTQLQYILHAPLLNSAPNRVSSTLLDICGRLFGTVLPVSNERKKIEHYSEASRRRYVNELLPDRVVLACEGGPKLSRSRKAD